MCDISNDLDGPITRVSRSWHFWTRISQKRCILGTKLLKNTNRKPYTIYRMIPLSIDCEWPLTPFQGHDIFRHWISQKRHEIEPYSYYRTSMGSHMWSITWRHFQWPWRTPNLGFKVMAFLKSNISKRCILGTKLLKNTNRKPYTIYRMIPLSMTVSDLWLHFKVRTFFEVEYRIRFWLRL